MVVTFLWNESGWKVKSGLATLLLTISPLAKTADAKYWCISEMPWKVPEKWQEFASYSLLEYSWPHDIAFVTILILGSGLAGTPKYLGTTAVFFLGFGDFSHCFISLIKVTTGQFLYQHLMLCAVFKSLCNADCADMSRYGDTLNSLGPIRIRFACWVYN